MEEEKDYRHYDHQDRSDTLSEYEHREPEHLVVDTVLEDRIFAALSYISILFVVPLILKNENEDIHFHSKQGLVLFGAEVAVWFVLLIFDGFLSVLFPSGDLFLVRMLGALAWVLFMGLSLAGVYTAARGKRWNLPFISRIASRIKV